MIELILKGLVINSSKINEVIDYINKMSKKQSVQIILIWISVLAITGQVSKNQKDIKLLKEQLKEKTEPEGE